MVHDRTMGIAAASAEAEAPCDSIALRECGIICGVSDIAAADAPLHIGADCPIVRLSSARPMFNGRVGAVSGNPAYLFEIIQKIHIDSPEFYLLYTSFPPTKTSVALKLSSKTARSASFPFAMDPMSLKP